MVDSDKKSLLKRIAVFFNSGNFSELPAWQSCKKQLDKLSAPLEFIGSVVLVLPKIFKRKGLRAREFFYYLDMCGVRSIGIVILISLLMGAVVALQSALQMRKVGTEIYVIDLVGFAVLKEFGPLMVAMIAIGRAGSAFAAEIGTMKVNEEISALSTMGIRPEAYLVLPKLMAMIVALPILTVIGDLAGIVGGMFVGVAYIDLPIGVYLERTFETLDAITFLLGVFKGIPFAILITLSGCYCGFTASGDALGVGRGATKAVVLSIFCVVVADALITLLYSYIGY
jgi:phospholipid/cholesterol/gamma-HCH transport system permease protein